MPVNAKSPALSLLLKNTDMLLVVLIIMMIFTIFIPMNTIVMDFMLVISISVSVIVLLTTIYVREPLQFSVFPSLLLVTTFFRLALNIASTRLILMNAPTHGTAAAGKVIETFGTFVAGNEPFIGFVLFVVIVIVQFVVITKGANRISEVAARFTLDAMPGKQMSIDADLNAGIIKEAEARERRAQISHEADFYGAMDGATKFVRGDAIAGIIITVVNIVMGIILGVVSYNMDIKEALLTFTKLTIGDGLVSQIPALIISISAGLIVTRTTAESNLGKDLVGQLFSNPRALYVAGGFLMVLVLTPLPKIPLFAIIIIIFIVAWNINKHRSFEVERSQVAQKEKESAMRKPEKVESLLYVDPMELEIGYSLIKLVDPAHGGDLLDRVAMIRRQAALELGIIVPPIRIRDNMQLEPSQYVIKIRGVGIASGTSMPDHYLAMDSGIVTGEVEGIRTKEPAFNLPALWISETQKQRAEALGYTVVDAITVVTTHLNEIIKSHSPDILTREDVSTLLSNLKETHPHLVEEVTPGLLKPGDIQKVLQNLLREGISVRDLVSILETLGDYASKTKDIEILTEYVRNSLARQICQTVLDKDGGLFVITVDPKLEDLIKNSIERTDSGSYITTPPAVINKILESASNELRKLITAGHPAVILCSPQIRFHLRKIMESSQSSINVLSYNEIVREARVESLGMITVTAT